MYNYIAVQGAKNILKKDSLEGSDYPQYRKPATLQY